MLPDSRIAEIERLRAEITPPPWIDQPHPEWSGGKHMIGVGSQDWVQASFSGVAHVSGTNDAAFIAASPTIVDDLLAERRELLAEMDRMAEELGGG